MRKHDAYAYKTRSVYWSFFEGIVFAAFLIWCVPGLLFTLLHVTPASVLKWPFPPGLNQFVAWCLTNGDPILILLAFFSTHLHAARQWSDHVARRWGAIIIVCAFVIETVGTLTGIPFGSYTYTDAFGPRVWMVPFTIPLAWHVIVTNALFLVRAVMPHVSTFVEAILVGLICTAYDFILEPFATTAKHYWNWEGGTVPLMNYISWFALSALLVWFFAPTLSTRHWLDPRPLLILVITVLIFLAGELH